MSTRKGPKPKPIAERFWPKVDKRGPDECWPWKASVTHQGYGHTNVNGRTAAAHRVSYELSTGPIPEGLGVLHRCDNPRCVNPAHLFLGTPADNTADMMAKQRTNNPKGEWHHAAKLTPDAVVAIRADNRDVPVIAGQYGVSEGAIWDIKARRTWTHVP